MKKSVFNYLVELAKEAGVPDANAAAEQYSSMLKSVVRSAKPGVVLGNLLDFIEENGHPKTYKIIRALAVKGSKLNKVKQLDSRSKLTKEERNYRAVILLLSAMSNARVRGATVKKCRMIIKSISNNTDMISIWQNLLSLSKSGLKKYSGSLLQKEWLRATAKSSPSTPKYFSMTPTQYNNLFDFTYKTKKVKFSQKQLDHQRQFGKRTLVDVTPETDSDTVKTSAPVSEPPIIVPVEEPKAITSVPVTAPKPVDVNKQSPIVVTPDLFNVPPAPPLNNSEDEDEKLPVDEVDWDFDYKDDALPVHEVNFDENETFEDVSSSNKDDVLMVTASFNNYKEFKRWVNVSHLKQQTQFPNSSQALVQVSRERDRVVASYAFKRKTSIISLANYRELCKGTADVKKYQEVNKIRAAVYKALTKKNFSKVFVDLQTKEVHIYPRSKTADLNDIVKRMEKVLADPQIKDKKVVGVFS